MLEVVFSDSLKGSIKVAKSYNKEDKLNGAFAYIGDEDSLNQLENLPNGEALTGSSDDVVCIGFNLDVGDINCEIDGVKRKNTYKELFSLFNFENEEIDRYFNLQRQDLNRLIREAKKGTPIRVWKNNSPYSLCAYAYLCDVLRNIDCKISVMELPVYWQNSKKAIITYSDWAQIHPNQFFSFLSIEREITTMEKHLQSNTWCELKKENSQLRAVVNGRLISVPVDFYDFLIANNLPEGEFKMASFIGTLLSKYPIGIGDFWYALRLNKMITDGILQVISIVDTDHPYGKVLKIAR